MKSAFLTLICLVTLAAQAEDRPAFRCNPSPDETGYHIEKTPEGNFIVTAHLPMGAEQAPIFSGDITTAALPKIQQKADLVRRLGKLYRVEILAANCKRDRHDGMYSIHCFTGGPIVLNGVDLYTFSFVATSKRVISMGRTDKGFQTYTDEFVEVGTTIGMPTLYGAHLHDFMRTYNGADCQSTESFWK